jgi:hypothetical protein
MSIQSLSALLFAAVVSGISVTDTSLASTPTEDSIPGINHFGPSIVEVAADPRDDGIDPTAVRFEDKITPNDDPGLPETPACEADSHVGGKWISGGCTPRKATCAEMFDACQDKGLPCTRVIEGKKTLCAFCLMDCTATPKRPYKYDECYKCGFDDPE